VSPQKSAEEPGLDTPKVIGTVITIERDVSGAVLVKIIDSMA